MTRLEYYSNRTEEFRIKTEKLKKLESKLSIARLITFLSGILVLFILIKISSAAAVSSLVLLMITFGWLVRCHAQTERKRKHFQYLQIINQRESECIMGKFDQFPDGADYVNTQHENSYDLDLFGRASLYQFINRTTSKPASDLLAEWLRIPAGIEEIPLRQQAVNELSERIEWRQHLVSLGYSHSESSADPEKITGWAKSDNVFRKPGRQKLITLLLSLLAILSTILIALLSLPLSLLVIVYSINFLYYLSQSRKINRIHNVVGSKSQMLQTYSSTVLLISDQVFKSHLLASLHGIFTERYHVSKEIRHLSILVNRLDARLNFMVAIPLNLYFFWDIQYCLALEKWKSKHGKDIEKWFSGMAHFEVLSSMANMAFNNPDWALPVVVPEYFKLSAINAGHPLIPADRRVSNNVSVEGFGKTVIITGSNMSGKSTFLRMIGVNAVLALAGAPVCAESFTISHLRIFSSMRISDSLEDNTSSFYAELKKLATIIKTVENDTRLLLLFDEILRGTNTNDRYTGSVALLKQLTEYQTVTFIATHDLKLAGLSDEMPEKIDNYHFDVKIEGEELYFDYKLNEGICHSMNASILMKKMGIRL